MKLMLLAVAAATLGAGPALAALPVGAKAPEFRLPAYKAGAPFQFDLDQALKKGPVVVYFFPAAFTAGCSIEAHDFAQAMDRFKAEGATVIGVTAGNTDQLAKFTTDTRYCSGKFPMAADDGAKVAKEYDASLMLRPGWSNRTSYVIAPDGKVLMAYSDLKPDQHVAKTLAAVADWRAKHPA